MMKDLVLEWKWMHGERNVPVPVILPNIQGQRYVFGSSYPGGKEGEEFFFCGNERILVDSTHMVIRVDKLGKYWIQSETAKFKTFVNSERLFVEPRLHEIGDVVLLEESGIRCGDARARHPIFHVKERIVPGPGRVQEIEGAGSDSDGDSGSEGYKAMNELDFDYRAADSPLDNALILEKIISYLPVEDLKNARLVCKQWKEEASKSIEKRSEVCFKFCEDYLNPGNSSRVFRYLHEMRDMKMRSIHIVLTPEEPGEKMLDDLRKLLKSSHNFSTLFLCAKLDDESDFHLFTLIFQEMGEKLVELRLELFYRHHLILPAILPPFPVMSRLKKFTDGGFLSTNPRWASHIVPTFSNSLEHFTCCSSHTADIYLQEFLKYPTPNLKGVAIKDEASVKSLTALLELETGLTFLEINYFEACTEREELLEKVLLKNLKSLQHLVLKIGSRYVPNPNGISFPSFPKLKELEVEYGPMAGISWETGLDYKKHFPSLRKLTVRPQWQWNNGDAVFNAFFPDQGELRCETVKEVWVPVLQKPNFPCHWPPRASQESFQSRMDRIRKMFPSAGNINFH